MSGFDLFADSVREAANTIPTVKVTDPGMFEGFVRGTGMAIMREAFAKPARSMSMLGAVAPIAVDAITGGTTLQDKYFRTHQDVVDRAVKFWTPGPSEVGVAAELTGGLIGTLGQIVLSPHLAVSNQILSQGEDLVTQPGVSAGQALAVGIAQGAGLGVGIWAPPALGYNLATKAATGAGVNLLQGILTRGASAAILGDNPAARNFPAFGGEEMLFDVLLGAAFGTAAHYVPRWKAEAEARTDQMWQRRAQAEVRAGAGNVTAFDLGAAAANVNNRFAAAVTEWSKNVTPTEQAALATMRVAKHLNADSMPGRPTGPASVEVHVAAMREAIQSLLTDQPVTARVTNDDGSPIQREPTQPATRDMLAQARQELEQGQPGAGYQELLDIMAEPPGPRRAELLGNLRPDLAQAKEAPADPEQASLWAEIHQTDPAAKPTPIADLEAAVRAWNPESPVFHVKQPPLFTPEQTAGAEARLTALEQEAARIAAQEGLPGKPLDPIDTWVEREVRQAGRPPEESQAAGAMWKAAFESFAKAAGVDPTQLFYRYMDRVIGYGAAQPDAATTLMQAGTRPANNIEAYAPQVIPSQRNRIPQFRARDIAMIKPDMMLSSASKGKRASWLIYSIDANNKAHKVGYVIADYNPADNTFHALRRIEIDDSLRGTGIGERTIAMMLRQNNGKPMEVHDIVHAGVQGTKDDALPFWKKLGIRLDNYSSNPDIQMDGRMTLADYLGARGGQGLREGRAGDAAQAVPADGAGSRGGGAGAGGGDAGRLFQRAPPASAEFQRFIEGTKVVDANGDPLIVYHGTSSDFQEFSSEKIGSNYGEDTQGFFFTSSAEQAGVHADDAGFTFAGNAEPNIVPVYLQLRNPAEFKTTGHPNDWYDKNRNYALAEATRLEADGIIVRGRAGEVVYVAFRPEQIKSAIGNTGAFDPQNANILFQSPTGRWYYSALSAAIDAAPPRAQNAGTWKQWLQAQINAGRIKETEVEWSGIRDFIDTQEGKISPDQLRAYMEQGGVRVEEVELGGRLDGMDRAVNDYEARTGRQAQDENGDWSEEFETSPEGRRFLKAAEQSNQPRFGTYQLPGAKPGSYRELALTLPRKPGPNALSVLEAAGLLTIRTGQNLYVMDRNGVRVNALDALPDLRDPNGRDATPQEQAAINLARYYEDNPGGNFEVPRVHSMGPDADTNRIAHIRFNERTTADGKRALFIEEIQSDWAQKGRDQGFVDGRLSDQPMKATINTSADRPYWEVRTDAGVFVGNIVDLDTATTTPEQAVAAAREVAARRDREGFTQHGVPRAPFIEKTEAWVTLVMKRMIRYAAENGFDQVAWTRGDQQVERYARALRKQVDRIEWTKTQEGVQLVGTKAGRQVVDTTQKETALSDAIGKTMAKQILEDPNQSGTIEGDAITIDDTGMAGFYDRIVPNVAKEVLRKLGGGTIRETEITVDGEPEWQQAFDITPEVKAKAMQAQALFQPAYHGSPHDFTKFSTSKIGTGEGAAAYGWGLYFAENPDVATGYHRQLSSGAALREMKLGSLRVNERNNFDYTRKAHVSDLENARASLAEQMIMAERELQPMTPEQRTKYVLDALDKRIADAREEWPEGVRPMQDLRRMLQTPGAIEFSWNEATGGVYKVDIPDDVVGHMLLWDKPFEQQPEAVRKAIESVGLKADGMTGEQIYREFADMVKTSDEADQVEAYRQASNALDQLGITGIRYLDAGSRSAGDGTHNLVVFNDKHITITHKDGKPITQAERDAYLQRPVNDARSQQAARGFLQIGDERKMLIALGKDADASTFMHESAHFFLEVMDDLSATVPALKADMEVLFKEWGIDRAAWDQMDLNGKRPYHEMFAESFEVYLMTNKAPTPELRTVFQRFRDWLLDIYQVATATGRKVSQPMRDLFDRMLDAQRRETTTTRAAQPTEGTPPPPRPEGGEPPGVVDPFDFETTGEPQPPAPLTLDDQGMREMIREAVEKESGWYQIGGRHMGGEHGVPNFSEWIPNGPWWVARPDKKLNAQGYINAVAKALVGDKLKPIEQRAVQYLLDHLNQRRVDEWKAARQEWDQLSAEVAAEGMQPTPENVIDANTVARAAAIDEAMVERLAIQYDGDDVGFMAEIRRMIDAQQNPATVQGGEGSQAAAPEVAQAAAVADGRGDGKPAAGRQPDAAREAADDPLAREADRVAVENPAMVLQFDQPDGTVVRMTAAQYLEQVRMEAELARQDVSLLEVAAECMLGARS